MQRITVGRSKSVTLEFVSPRSMTREVSVFKVWGDEHLMAELGPGLSLFGVFDGHGGEMACQRCAEGGPRAGGRRGRGRRRCLTGLPCSSWLSPAAGGPDACSLLA